MWFFDSVLEENTSTVVGTTAVTSQKTDEQDGSFLIIDDSVTTADIPDTAVKLFDEEPVAEISATEEMVSTSNKEISFFSETPAPADEAPEDEVMETTEDLVATEPEVIVEDAQEETSEVSEAITEDYSQGDASVASTETYDIFAPVRKAIAEYNEYIAERTKIADIKSREIDEQNARIAEAKAAAKAALDERKKIEAEIDRARQMQGVFTAQLEK